MGRPAVLCRCSQSIAAICGLFVSLAVAAILAEDRCRDAGGWVSDAGWACELASGATSSLWDLVSLPGVALVFLVVGVPVYFLVGAIRVG